MHKSDSGFITLCYDDDSKYWFDDKNSAITLLLMILPIQK